MSVLARAMVAPPTRPGGASEAEYIISAAKDQRYDIRHVTISHAHPDYPTSDHNNALPTMMYPILDAISAGWLTMILMIRVLFPV